MLRAFLTILVCGLLLTSTAEARSLDNASMGGYNPFSSNPVVSHHSGVPVGHRLKTKRRNLVHKQRHRHAVARTTAGSAHIRNPVGPVTSVETAAGITIKVADSLAAKFQGFIKDIVAAGYEPKKIHCFASGGHVTFSRHYVGAACDFDQSCWGCTVPFMHHVSKLAHKWGLRDGCDFNDCGHIDDGMVPSKIASKHWPLMYREINKGG